MGSQHKAVFSLSFSFLKAEEGVSVLMKRSGGLEDQEMALGHGGKEHPTPPEAPRWLLSHASLPTKTTASRATTTAPAELRS